ncbi:MAG: hypothetical protein JNM79_23085 [Burkholderiales bacterium]|nr:hypothetical protein [Burkholderiales bacterium]
MDVPAFIDLEASGLGGRSHPIEVGLVTANGQAYCSLLTPDPGWTHWDARAESVHGITQPILAAHGKPLPEVAANVNALLEGTTAYSDAWGNDYAWLCKLFDAAEVPMRFRVESLRKLLTDAEAGRWAEVKAQVAAELNFTRHRASNDARILQQTLARIRRGVGP